MSEPNDRADRTTAAAAPKKLRTRHVTMITLGGIIGASLFVGSGNVVRAVGPAAVLSYLIGGLLVYLAMRMLGEMAASRPAVGSFMEYARQGLGNWAAYFVGWLYWYFWVGVIAFEAVVSGTILSGWMPGVPEWVFSLIMMFVFTATNLVSLRSFGEVEFWLASVKVAAIAVFLVVGVLFALGLWPHATFSLPNLWVHGGFAPNGLWPVVSGVAIVIFSYFGTEIAVMAASESENPAKGVRQTTSTVIWRILLFFVGSILLVVTIVPWNELPDPSDIAPFAYIFGLFGLPGAELVMSAVILTAVCSVLNSGLYSAARMFAALADQGLAPSVVAKRSRSGVPYVAVLASTLGGYAAVIVNFVAPESGIFDFIMNSAGLVALFVYVLIAITQMRLRSRMTPEERDALPLRMWLHPWLGVLVIVAIVGIVVVMLVTADSTRAQVWTSLVSVALLAVFWPLVRRTLARRRALGQPTPTTAVRSVHDPGLDEAEHGTHQ
ncbi:amino acid permease [Pseudoclavibacter chungangensis]|uniref:Amino acid permease n=1 Tax=Pseudoclavibacter chungangensis TaxID=587635 RepID=A0A7J5BT19_9MICO|nr:amino acid permease [Pseudoclavibacter chungangensis]KAB1656697.1 amino acid permease [Pseudoclavibacter chungangensis]NYJ67849.1 GABA permease [Pseudoclavibacter chungangensis]